MCWPWRKKTLPPLILVRRSEKIVWTKEDAGTLKAFTECPVWQKLVKVIDDKLINALAKDVNKNVVRGFKLCLREIEARTGGKSVKEDESDTGELSSIEFQDDEN
jgi:hypothetical protein